ncbi:uncharacterized protein C8R40DRAFT_1067326 [Lentinula edodes]|uniref:uncharacterized protein n=1 Tax=Lentinula edodes TaxID=5353 RepID=UPI001E8CCB16|nr:uncharacterized protein C8R40DRAFT_1067326 [Lentinula edodes]KAH7878299.1 hypothetical protein C8R40DRAFT_1067326 [Lentinula edodes]KAJ3912455.1 hypothetical protein F5877DRAFT_72382 [Lentinula edodes]
MDYLHPPMTLVGEVDKATLFSTHLTKLMIPTGKMKIRDVEMFDHSSSAYDRSNLLYDIRPYNKLPIVAVSGDLPVVVRMVLCQLHSRRLSFSGQHDHFSQRNSRRNSRSHRAHLSDYEDDAGSSSVVVDIESDNSDSSESVELMSSTTMTMLSGAQRSTEPAPGLHLGLTPRPSARQTLRAGVQNSHNSNNTPSRSRATASSRPVLTVRTSLSDKWHIRLLACAVIPRKPRFGEDNFDRLPFFALQYFAKRKYPLVFGAPSHVGLADAEDAGPPKLNSETAFCLSMERSFYNGVKRLMFKTTPILPKTNTDTHDDEEILRDYPVESSHTNDAELVEFVGHDEGDHPFRVAITMRLSTYLNKASWTETGQPVILWPLL